MKKKLFEAVFKKAKDQSGSTTRNGLSNHLEEHFTEKLKLNVNSITFIRYHKKYIENDIEITSNPSSDLLNKSAEYLDYKSYEDFVSKNSIKKAGEITIVNYDRTGYIEMIKKNKAIFILSMLLVISSIAYFSVEKQRWMVWNETHYTETKFNPKKYDIKQLKIYKQERIKHFKKIKPSCDIKYFSENGNVKIWYGKNRKGKLEIFTSLGLHPETGKTLKPITRYMIKKYFCKDYK